MNTSEVLYKAADHIEERGWTQGGSDKSADPWTGDSGGGICLEGGIAAAAGLELRYGGFPDLYDCPAYWAVASHLNLNPWPTSSPIKDAVWGWNDTIGRTASEVIEVLRACAVIEAAREDQDAAYATYEQNVVVA